jgi:hypothetical protein
MRMMTASSLQLAGNATLAAMIDTGLPVFEIIKKSDKERNEKEHENIV